MDIKLEPELQGPYDSWKSDPTPDSTAAFLKEIDPIINKAIKTHVGKPNPLIRGRARRMALESLPKYDPSRSRLQTHLYNQLQGLKRYNAQQGHGVKVPERVVLDRHVVDTATQELRDELGREPSDGELSERTGYPLKRIGYVRGYNPSMSQGFFQGVGESTGGSFLPNIEQPASDAWIQLIYDDLDPIDQNIMEYSLGLNGQPVLSNQEIAVKLKRSPGAISQRKQRIQMLLNQEDELSPF
jgi:DNA-directed RNA polymerase specialized sigma subunit